MCQRAAGVKQTSPNRWNWYRAEQSAVARRSFPRISSSNSLAQLSDRGSGDAFRPEDPRRCYAPPRLRQTRGSPAHARTQGSSAAASAPHTPSHSSGRGPRAPVWVHVVTAVANRGFVASESPMSNQAYSSTGN